MALGPLADLIVRLTAGAHTSALANRKAFNTNPTADVAGLSAAQLHAFLTLHKAAVSQQVLDDLARQDEQFRSTGADLRDYVLWLYDFARWDFEPTEESEYSFGFTPPGGTLAAYPDPACEITAVRLTAQPKPGGGTKAELEIYGQGFLPGRTIVNIAPETGGPAVYQKRVEPDAGSTFRGGRIRVTNLSIPAGTYRATVGIDLGDGSQFLIDKPVANTRFTAV